MASRIPTAPAIPASVQRVLAIRVSFMFAAILDFVLDNPNPCTDPQVTSLCITSDGFLMDWNTDRPHKQGFVGHVSDFDRNMVGVCEAAGLDPVEVKRVVDLAYSRITDWRPEAQRRGCAPYRTPFTAVRS